MLKGHARLLLLLQGHSGQLLLLLLQGHARLLLLLLQGHGHARLLLLLLQGHARLLLLLLQGHATLLLQQGHARLLLLPLLRRSLPGHTRLRRRALQLLQLLNGALQLLPLGQACLIAMSWASLTLGCPRVPCTRLCWRLALGGWGVCCASSPSSMLRVSTRFSLWLHFDLSTCCSLLWPLGLHSV